MSSILRERRNQMAALKTIKFQKMKLTAGLKTIDQSGIKTHIKERLENPGQYTARPLIIWRADLRDGIQERVLRDVFNDYNRYRATHVWYKMASVRKMPRTKADVLHDMLTAKYVDRNNNRPYTPVYGVGGKEDLFPNALFVIDPVMVARDYSRTPDALVKFQSLINNREWNGVKLTDGIPVVAYMCLSDEWFETYEAYPDAEQYIFEPDIKEFAEWAVSGMSQTENDFIRDTASIFPEITADFLRKKFKKVSPELLNKVIDYIIESNK